MRKAAFGNVSFDLPRLTPVMRTLVLEDMTVFVFTDDDVRSWRGGL
jgi:hypothetical protein